MWELSPRTGRVQTGESLPYLVHPDKLAAIEALIQKQNATRKAKGKTTPGGNPAKSATGSPLIDAMAQKMFLERQMKQQGRM
jgi:hypothetical protein